jgi:hypothetical protein
VRRPGHRRLGHHHPIPRCSELHLSHVESHARRFLDRTDPAGRTHIDSKSLVFLSIFNYTYSIAAYRYWLVTDPFLQLHPNLVASIVMSNHNNKMTRGTKKFSILTSLWYVANFPTLYVTLAQPHTHVLSLGRQRRLQRRCPGIGRALSHGQPARGVRLAL